MFSIWKFAISLFFLSILLQEVGVASEKKQHENHQSVAIDLIEKFIQDGISSDEVKKRLGKPDKIHEDKQVILLPGSSSGYRVQDDEIYYYQKTRDEGLWYFHVNNESHQITRIRYNPRHNPRLKRVEDMLQTWKKYHCEKKSETIVGFGAPAIKISLLECAGGRIRAVYNKSSGVFENIDIKGTKKEKSP